jgi:hypothetical protein
VSSSAGELSFHLAFSSREDYNIRTANAEQERICRKQAAVPKYISA